MMDSRRPVADHRQAEAAGVKMSGRVYVTELIRSEPGALFGLVPRPGVYIHVVSTCSLPAIHLLFT